MSDVMTDRRAPLYADSTRRSHRPAKLRKIHGPDVGRQQDRLLP